MQLMKAQADLLICRVSNTLWQIAKPYVLKSDIFMPF